jgi:hypothetical protein
VGSPSSSAPWESLASCAEAGRTPMTRVAAASAANSRTLILFPAWSWCGPSFRGACDKALATHSTRGARTRYGCIPQCTGQTSG